MRPSPINSPTYKVYPEKAPVEQPVAFVTARRFWLLCYMFVGASGFAMLVARFVLRPLHRKLNAARQDYLASAQGSLSRFSTDLASLITSLPGRNIIVDTKRHRLYVNTETQTDTDDMGNVVLFDATKSEITKEDRALQDLASSVYKFGQKSEEEEYLSLSGKMSDLRTYLQDFESYGYKALHTSYTAVETNKSTNGASEAVQKVKAEIRSVKGSLLNARTFQHASLRPATDIKP